MALKNRWKSDGQGMVVVLCSDRVRKTLTVTVRKKVVVMYRVGSNRSLEWCWCRARAGTELSRARMGVRATCVETDRKGVVIMCYAGSNGTPVHTDRSKDGVHGDRSQGSGRDVSRGV